jgi:hypothetical protein
MQYTDATACVVRLCLNVYEASALSDLPAAIAASVSSALAAHLRTGPQPREAHLVSVRLWNSGNSDSAAASPDRCDAKKLRVLSFADLCDKVARSFSLLPNTGTSAVQQLSQLSLSAAAASNHSLSPSFTLYYLLDPSRWWDSRVKVEDDDSFELLVSRPSYLRPTLLIWRAPADCSLVEHQQLHASEHHHSPLKEGPPPQQHLSLALLTPGSAAALASPAKSSTSSRSSAQQADFADAVRHRDDDKCVVCGAEQVEAAHVVPVKDDRTAAGKASAQLLSLYDPRNGLTLCTHCHDYFDAGLWCISPMDRCSIAVSDALLAHRPVWVELQGAKVRLPSHHTNVDNWPSALTLQVQVDFVASRRVQRLHERKSYPYACGSCGARLMTKAGLTQHGRYCGGRGHLKPSQFHTPQKQSKQPSRRRGVRQPARSDAEAAAHAVGSATTSTSSTVSQQFQAAASSTPQTRSSNADVNVPAFVEANSTSSRDFRMRNRHAQLPRK